MGHAMTFPKRLPTKGNEGEYVPNPKFLTDQSNEGNTNSKISNSFLYPKLRAVMSM